jgi:hypothetical protein
MAVLIKQPALAAALMDLCVRGSTHRAAATLSDAVSAQTGGSSTAAGSSSFSSSMDKAHSAAAPATFARTLLIVLAFTPAMACISHHV